MRAGRRRLIQLTQRRFRIWHRKLAVYSASGLGTDNWWWAHWTFWLIRPAFLDTAPAATAGGSVHAGTARRRLSSRGGRPLGLTRSGRGWSWAFLRPRDGLNRFSQPVTGGNSRGATGAKGDAVDRVVAQFRHRQEASSPNAAHSCSSNKVGDAAPGNRQSRPCPPDKFAAPAERR